jgi:anti-sigma factor RsiW
MGCAEAFEKLSSGLDGELDPTEAWAVRSHIEGCPVCRRKHALLAAAQKAVRLLPAETVSAGFDAALRQRLEAERVGPRGSTLRPWLRTVAVGVAALLVLALAIRPGRHPEEEAALEPDSRLTVVPRFHPAALDCGIQDPAADCRADAPCASAAQCGQSLSRYESTADDR